MAVFQGVPQEERGRALWEAREAAFVQRLGAGDLVAASRLMATIPRVEVGLCDSRVLIYMILTCWGLGERARARALIEQAFACGFRNLRLLQADAPGAGPDLAHLAAAFADQHRAAIAGSAAAGPSGTVHGLRRPTRYRDRSSVLVRDRAQHPGNGTLLPGW